MQSVALYLQTLRTSQGLSRARLAELAGTTEMSVLRIEKQGQEPSGSLLVRMVRALHGSWDVVAELLDADDAGAQLRIAAELQRDPVIQAAAPAERQVAANRLEEFLRRVAAGEDPQVAARDVLGYQP